MNQDEADAAATREGELGVEGAERLRERVYGAVSVIAALAATLYANKSQGAGSVVVTLADTVGALFLASLFADVTAHVAEHQAPPDRAIIRSLLKSRSQILAAAALPIVLLVAAGLGWWQLSTAIGWAVAAEIATLGGVGVLAVRGTTLPLAVKTAVVLAEVLLGLLIVAVKVLAH